MFRMRNIYRFNVDRSFFDEERERAVRVSGRRELLLAKGLTNKGAVIARYAALAVDADLLIPSSVRVAEPAPILPTCAFAGWEAPITIDYPDVDTGDILGKILAPELAPTPLDVSCMSHGFQPSNDKASSRDTTGPSVSRRSRGSPQ